MMLWLSLLSLILNVNKVGLRALLLSSMDIGAMSKALASRRLENKDAGFCQIARLTCQDGRGIANRLA